MSLFGRCFRVFTFGESHSPMTGCVVEGFPSNFKLNMEEIQKQLNRRKPGQSSISTPRKEEDIVQCISGIENGVTLGSPLCFLVKNMNVKKNDYDMFKDIPRPGHADLTYLRKYGIKAASGGGRSSARETIGRVIAGGVAKQFLKTKGISFAAWVHSVGVNSLLEEVNNRYIEDKLSNEKVEELGKIWSKDNKYYYYRNNKSYQYTMENENQREIQHINFEKDYQMLPNIRCPQPKTAIKMFKQIQSIKQEGDSLGGVIQSCIYNLPFGLGEPVFDKIQALMAHAMLSIPATKGFQFGSGFRGTRMKGSEHNDLFGPGLKLSSNHAGGSLGGISNGETFDFKIAFKPVSTISKTQITSNLNGDLINLQAKGRHDPCVLPRAPPIVDCMAAMVIMDLLMIQKLKQDSQ